MEKKKRVLCAVGLGAFLMASLGVVFFNSNANKISSLASNAGNISKHVLDGYDRDVYENEDENQYAFLAGGTDGELSEDELNELLYDEDGWSADKQAHFKTIVIKGDKKAAASLGNSVKETIASLEEEDSKEREPVNYEVTRLSDDLCAITFSTEEAAYYAHTQCVSNQVDVSYEAVFDVSDNDEAVENTESESMTIETVEDTEDDAIYMNLETEPSSTEPVTIALLDTGYSGDSERIVKGINTVDGSTKETEDENGHGTRMAQIIESMTYDNVKIMPVKVANKDGFATVLSTYAGIQYAIEKDVDIINISMNARVSETSFLLTEAIKQATDQGIQVVVSAGNRSMDVSKVTPSNIEEATVISAVDVNGEFADYSNYGETVDYATFGNYDGVNGTSNAAARMSAMYAYVMGIEGADAEELIHSAAKNPNEEDWDEQYGYGVVNPYDVYKKADYAFASGMFDHTHTEGVTWKGKTDTDLGPGIMDLDWKKLNTEDLDLYLRDTHYAFVGEFLASLSDEDLELLKERSNIVNSDVEEQVFTITDDDVLLGGDLEVKSEETTPFIDYCLQSYEEHKDDLVVSTAETWWWYDNSVGYLYLNDVHGVTKFTISTPYMSNFDEINHFNSTSVLSGLNSESVVKGDASKKVIRVGKTAEQSSDSPRLSGARAVSAGAANFISIISKNAETNVVKSTASAAKSAASGESNFMLQFTFDNYDMGTALEEGQSWYTNFFGDAGSAEAYDFNVRPYGYYAGVDKNGAIANWNTAKADEYWETHTSSVPAGKKYTEAQLSQAIYNTNHQYDKMWQGQGYTYSWVDYFQSDKELQNYNSLTFVDGTDFNNNGNVTETLTERNVLQHYIRIEPDNTSRATSYPATIRKASLTTRKLSASDRMDIWYLPGGCNFSASNGLGVIAAYDGESYATVKRFMKEVVGISTPTEAQIAKYFTRIDQEGGDSNFHTFVSGSKAKYLPNFNAADYYLTNQSLIESFGLYKLGMWRYKSVSGQSTNGGQDSQGNTQQIGTPALFTNESSYDDEAKKLTVSGSTYGLTVYAKWSKVGGTGEDIVEEMDIPEIRVQTTVNNVTVSRSVALADKWYEDQDIVNNWLNATKSITGVSTQVMYGQDYTDSGDYTPSISNFKPTSERRITVVRPDGSSVVYGAGTNITQLVKDTLAEPGMNGAMITIETLYDATGLSTVYVKPTRGKWTYNGATYTEDNPAIITKQPGSQISIPNPDINTLNYVATFDGNGGTPTASSAKTNLSWNADNGWTLNKADAQGNIVGGSANGTLINQSGKTYNTAVNYMDNGTWNDCSYWNAWGGQVTGSDADQWWTATLYNVPTGEKFFQANPSDQSGFSGGSPRSNIGSGWITINNNTYKKTESTTLKMSLFTTSSYTTRLAKEGNSYYCRYPNGVLIGGPYGIFPAYKVYGYSYKFGNTEGATDVLTPNITGSTVITLPNASKSGATFLYWKLAYDPDLDPSDLNRTYAAWEQVDMSKFKKDVTFIAYYSDNVYTLTLVRDGKENLQPACVDGDTVTYVTGGKYTKTARGEVITKINVPTKNGYEFQGYKLGNKKVINADGTFAVDGSYYTSDATLYAEWTYKKCKLTFDMGTPTIENKDTADPYMIEYYDKYFEDSKGQMTSSIEYPLSKGLRFEGYYTGRDGSGVEIVDRDGVILVGPTYFEEDQTLYAKWGPAYYDVELEFNDGSTGRVPIVGVTLQYGKPAGGIFDTFDFTPVRTGYTFTGWYDKPIGGNPVYNPTTGAQIPNSKYWDPDGNYQYYDTMVLYAHWVANNYQVAYDGNKATSGTMANSQHTYNVTKPLSKNQYEKTQTVSYADGINQSSTTMVAVPDSFKKLIFEGWNADIKIPNDLRLDSCVGTVAVADSVSANVILNTAALPVTYKISNSNIADVAIEGNAITITGKNAGYALITFQTGTTEVYEQTSATYLIVVKN